MPEWSHQTHKWVYPTIEPKNDPNGARGAEIWLLKVGRYRSQNCVFTVISPTFDQPYLSAACSVWGVLRLNRGSRKLTWVMASTPPAGRVRARRYGAATSRMSPRDTRGTWWCQGSASKPPDGCVCTWEWSHQTHKWVYPTIEPKNDPNGARGAEIWLLKVGRYRSQNCVFTVISPTFDQPYLSAA